MAKPGYTASGRKIKSTTRYTVSPSGKATRVSSGSSSSSQPIKVTKTVFHPDGTRTLYFSDGSYRTTKSTRTGTKTIDSSKGGAGAGIRTYNGKQIIINKEGTGWVYAQKPTQRTSTQVIRKTRESSISQPVFQKITRQTTRTERLATKVSAAEKRLMAGQDLVFRKLKIQPNYNSRQKLKQEGTLVERGKNYALEFGKAIARFPFELAGLPLVIGGRATLATSALFGEDYEKRELVKAATETPKAIVQMYDPRNPEGLLNIIITVAAVKGLAKSRAARVKFNKQMNKAKITRAKVKVVEKPGGKYQITKRGILKIGKKKIPFKERTLISKKNIRDLQFKGRSIAKYKIKAKSLLKKAKVKTKTVKTKIKGKEVYYIKRPGHKPTVVRQTAGKIKGKKINLKFKTTVADKKITSMAYNKKGAEFILGKIKKLRSPTKNVKTFNVVAAHKYLPKKSLIKILKANSKIIKLKLKNPKLTTFAKRNLKQNLRTINKAINKAAKSLPKGKKGQLAMPRERFKPIGRDTTAIDNILKNFERKMRVIEKAKTQVKTQSQLQVLVKKVKALPKSRALSLTHLESIFAGARSVLTPKLIVIPPAIPISGFKSIPSLTQVVKVEPGLTSKEGVGVAQETITGQTAVTIPRTSSSSSVINTFFTTTAGITSFITSGFVPFVGGAGGPSAMARRFRKGLTGLPIQDQFLYLSDLYSRIYGIKATKKERKKLLIPGRIFTGLELRKQI